MTLRVEDLKPGDVVRMDLKFIEFDVDGEAILDLPVSGRTTWATSEDLAAGNAELVVRPRPVRKGDRLLTGRVDSITFLCIWDGLVYFDEGDGPDFFRLDQIDKSKVTHADGSPIDWEASE